MKMKTFVRNDITISYPAGFANVNRYLETLRNNLLDLQARSRAPKSNRPRFTPEYSRELEARYLTQIAYVEKRSHNRPDKTKGLNRPFCYFSTFSAEL